MMIRNIFRNIALLLTLIIFICFSIACIAPWINPGITTIPTYFVMIMPVWWILMVLSTILWIIKCHWKISIVLTLAIILSFPLWRNVIVINNPDKTHSGKELSILTYNIHIFQNQSKFEEIIDFIKETDADIVCLQEFGFFIKHGHSQKEILARFDSLYPYRHLWYKNQNRSSHNGLATFSKYPIVNKKKIDYSSKNNISIYSDIKIGNDTIRVINNHLESNRLSYHDRRFAEIITNEKSSKEEIIDVSRNVSLKLGSAAKNRAKQALVIRKTIDQTCYPIIAVGDFNDVPMSYTYNKIKGDLKDTYSMAGKWGYSWTYNENNMLFTIDHILVDKRYKTITSKIQKVNYSDHYPLNSIISMD